MSSTKRLALDGAAVLAAGLVTAPTQAAAILSVSPAASTIQAGEQLDLDLDFGPTIIDFLGASRGDLLPVDVDANGDPIDLFLALENSDSVSVFDSRACDILSDPGCLGVSGGGRLATLTFRGSHAGLSSLTFGNVLLTDAFSTCSMWKRRAARLRSARCPSRPWHSCSASAFSRLAGSRADVPTQSDPRWRFEARPSVSLCS